MLLNYTNFFRLMLFIPWKLLVMHTGMLKVLCSMIVSFLLFFNSFPISWEPPILKFLFLSCWFFLLLPIRMLNFGILESCMNTELLLVINIFEFVKIAKKKFTEAYWEYIWLMWLYDDVFHHTFQLYDETVS